MDSCIREEGKLTPILHTGLYVHPVLNAKPPLDGVHTFTSLFFKHLSAFCPSIAKDRELEREQWNSRFTKYGFEGN